MMDERMFEGRVRAVAAEATALPAPADAWEQIARRVRAGDAMILPLEPQARRGRREWLRAAIVVVLLGGAAAAAALPASPVRQWLSDVFGSEPTPPAGPAAPVDAPETVLLVEPVDGAVVVAFETPATGVRISVRFGGAAELELRASGAAAGAQFRSSAGRITVVNAAAGAVQLTVPNSIARVRLEVDGRVYLTKENGQVRVLAPTADTVGAEIILPITR